MKRLPLIVLTPYPTSRRRSRSQLFMYVGSNTYEKRADVWVRIANVSTFAADE